MGSPPPVKTNNAKFPFLLFSQAPNRPDGIGNEEMTRINQIDVERWRKFMIQTPANRSSRESFSFPFGGWGLPWVYHD